MFYAKEKTTLDGIVSLSSMKGRITASGLVCIVEILPPYGRQNDVPETIAQTN
jgi:hypothetical protein